MTGRVISLHVRTEKHVAPHACRGGDRCEPCTHTGELLGVPDREAFRPSPLGRRGALCTVSAVWGPIHVGDAVELLVRA